MLNGLLLLHLLLASIAMDAIIMDTVITDTGFLRFIYNIYVEGEILNINMLLFTFCFSYWLAVRTL